MQFSSLNFRCYKVMNRKFLVVLLAFTFLGSSLSAKVNLEEAESALVKLLDAVRTANNDKVRNEHNESFKVLLTQTLKDKAAFDYDFSKLEMCTQKAPDNSFRLFNWNVANDNYTHQYYCFVAFKNPKTKEMQVEQLRDRTNEISKVETRQLYGTHWYGALYYEIIPVKKGKSKFYTLLGWKGHDKLTTQKVIDVISISSKGIIKLGAPIFKMNRSVQRRVVFKYSSDYVMSLKYNAKDKEIIFNKLQAADGRMEGKTPFIGPMLAFEGLRLEKGRWIYEKDVEVKAKKDAKDKLHNIPEGDMLHPQDRNR